ncbi:MAG: hypothetical protein NTV32_09180 [Gammaproteobacteria bacterium]|nr:hypothetical protein [Gammaproteobacteria bacterium]
MKNLLITAALSAAFCGTAFAATAAPATAMPAATTAASATTATITITPMKKSSLLASGTVAWAPHATDKLAVQWTGPNNSDKGNCRNTMHKLKMGYPVFKDSRTPWYKQANGTPVECTGNWTAAVVNLSTGKTLATASYTVSK